MQTSGMKVSVTCVACGAKDSIGRSRADILIDAGWTPRPYGDDEWLCPKCSEGIREERTAW